MPRKPRTISSTGIYHITLRSVNQHIIFEEDADYQKFLFLLSECKIKHDIDIYAYCLMNNHIHLLLHSQPENLSAFFQGLGSKFVRWYNRKYLRYGYLFQDRFHSEVIEDSERYLEALFYIHNNPVKANVCRYPSEYRWSSCKAFYGAKNPLINLSFSYDIAGSKDSLLKYFAEHQDDSEEDHFFDAIDLPAKLISDEKALQMMKKYTNLSSASEISLIRKKERNQLILYLRQSGVSAKQIARLVDVSVTTVNRICQNGQ